MDFTKIQVLLITILAFTGLSSSLVFKLSVDQELKYSTQDLNYAENVEKIQNINISVQNTGSVGCVFRLRSTLNSSNGQERYYSRPHSMWPGQEARLKIYQIPRKTGLETTNISLKTCEGWQKLETLNYTVENTLDQQNLSEIDFERKKAQKGSITIKTNVKNALAVPEEAPPYWKVPPTQIQNKSAELTYTPEIYRPEENISYRIINTSSGKLLGTIDVPVEPKKTLIQSITVMHLSYVLLVSLLINFAFIYRRREGILSSRS